MMGKRPAGVFITGTGTGVGKTYIAAALARALFHRGTRVGVYKPVLSGCAMIERPATTLLTTDGAQPPDDDLCLWQAAGRPGALADVSPQRFRAPLAPHLAARREGRTVDEALLRTGIEPWLESSDFLLVEGAGGLFSPLTPGTLNADLAREFGFPLLLVAANQLGALHATLATLLAARHFDNRLAVAAIVLNDTAEGAGDVSREFNRAELVARCAPSPVFSHGFGDPALSAELVAAVTAVAGAASLRGVPPPAGSP